MTAARPLPSGGSPAFTVRHRAAISQGLRGYPVKLPSRRTNLGARLEARRCNVGPRSKPPQPSPRPQAATAGVSAHAAPRHKHAPAKPAFAPPPLLRHDRGGHRHATVCVITARPLRGSLRLAPGPRTLPSGRAILLVITVRRLRLQPRAPGVFPSLFGSRSGPTSGATPLLESAGLYDTLSSEGSGGMRSVCPGSVSHVPDCVTGGHLCAKNRNTHTKSTSDRTGQLPFLHFSPKENIFWNNLETGRVVHT